MTINWPLIAVLFCLSIPGTLIAIKRLIYFLLPDNTEELKKRVCRFAVLQTLIMVLLMSFAGTVISRKTGLQALTLESVLEGKAKISILLSQLLPAVFYAFFGLLIFLGIYHGLVARFLDKKNLIIMTKIRQALGLDGCMLYGGVVEELIARWGLMNLAAFFILILTAQISPLMMWLSIFISGLIFAIGQLPAYLAAGCTANRTFIYSFIILSLSQSVLFGYLFWQYGLVCSILAHMLFHLGWWVYESKCTHHDVKKL